MNGDELRRIWGKFSEGNDFILNPDGKHVDMIVEGLLANEKECGLKLCPCRLRDETRQRDLELVCPCNFKTHETWRTQGRCWCGLFIKRR
ncbi:MAG: ferredoxin-thioredoxin reductase catalytic domain-containing protein [Candidatus Altiarchaeota archaeon]